MLTYCKKTNKDQERTWAKLNSVYLAFLYMAIKLLWFIDFFFFLVQNIFLTGINRSKLTMSFCENDKAAILKSLDSWVWFM